MHLKHYLENSRSGFVGQENQSQTPTQEITKLIVPTSEKKLTKIGNANLPLWNFMVLSVKHMKISVSVMIKC